MDDLHHLAKVTVAGSLWIEPLSNTKSEAVDAMSASVFLRFGQPPELDEGRETDDAGLRRPTARWQPVAPGGASCVAGLQYVYDGSTGEHRPAGHRCGSPIT
jgi:hypothetical protein